jgi:Asp-tRNA(Asn)/Glu-tRNA(Gln) amidotransferase A subunit family amidase
MTDPADLGLAAQAAAVRAGTVTAEQLVGAALDRIRRRDPQIRAFVHFDDDGALEAARACDREKGGRCGPLHGVPVAVKEVFDVAGWPCPWGTPIHKRRVPTQDAPVVKRLKDAGAVIVGNVVSTEYAIARPGPTVNPHDAMRTPGGSSSGPAAAVAAGMVPMALGSQTIGSIVRPSLYCGVFGLKPTRGAIDPAGNMILSEHLDHVGPIARYVDDIALAFSVLAKSPPEGEGPARLRVIHALGPFQSRVEKGTRVALERAKNAFAKTGIVVEELTLPAMFDGAWDDLQILLQFGIARHHGQDRDRAGDLMSERVRELIDAGRAIGEAEHTVALLRQEACRRELVKLFEPGVVVLAAAVDGVAPKRNDVDTGAPHLQALWTYAGLPTLAVPCGTLDGLPVGVQIVCGPGRESRILGAARRIESILR